MLVAPERQVIPMPPWTLFAAAHAPVIEECAGSIPTTGNVRCWHEEVLPVRIFRSKCNPRTQEKTMLIALRFQRVVVVLLLSVGSLSGNVLAVAANYPAPKKG
jgi:hypothetical protein